MSVIYTPNLLNILAPVSCQIYFNSLERRRCKNNWPSDWCVVGLHWWKRCEKWPRSLSHSWESPDTVRCCRNRRSPTSRGSSVKSKYFRNSSPISCEKLFLQQQSTRDALLTNLQW